MKDEGAELNSSGSADPSPEPLSFCSEFDFIQHVKRLVAERNGSTHPLIGIGDDAAVIEQRSGRELVITTDLLVEGIDFKRETTTPFLLGHKALAVSLSDIAAMGARPRWALLSIGVPQQVWQPEFLKQLYEGFLALASRYNVKLIGGDTSRVSDHVVIDSIVVGESGLKRSVLRSGAKVGDQIFVTGSLGGAAAGLRLLDHGARLGNNKLDQEEPCHDVESLLLRHLKPEPRVGWGVVLGEQNLPNAMIDLSDGLSSDLNHVCSESSVGALIESVRLPKDPSVVTLSGRRALDPLALALHGGEDFELLFTMSPDKINKLPAKVDGITVSRIGEVRPGEEGVKIREHSRVWELNAGGWDHFVRTAT